MTFLRNHAKGLLVLLLLILAIGGAGLLYLRHFVDGKITILMYHSVSEIPVNDEAADLSVRPQEFEAQLAAIQKMGYETIFATDLATANTKKKQVVITLDDGYDDNYTNVFPLLKQYNMKATIYMICDLIDRPGYLSRSQLREMADSGLVEIGSHTCSHVPMATGLLVREDVEHELYDSQEILESILDRPVRTLSYPNGSFDETIAAMAQPRYDVICSGTGFRAFRRGDERDVYRVGIYRRHDAAEVREIIGRRDIYMIKRLFQKLFTRSAEVTAYAGQ